MHILPYIQMVESSKEYLTISRQQNGNGPLYDIQIYGERLNCHCRSITRTAKIILLYVPETGMFSCFFWATRQTINIEYFLKSHLIFLLDNKMTSFYLPGFTLWVRESTERYNTYEEGYENTLNKLEKNLEAIGQLNSIKWYRFVELRKYLKREFFLEEPKEPKSLFDISAINPQSVGKLAQITYSDSKWHLKLEGSANRKATIILKDDYNNEEEPILLSDDYYKHRDMGSMIDDYEVIEVSGDCVIENPVKMWKKGSESIIHGAENYPEHQEFLKKRFGYSINQEK